MSESLEVCYRSLINLSIPERSPSQERLRSHAKAFDGLLQLIPAKLYYGEDTSVCTCYVIYHVAVLWVITNGY